MAKLLGTLILIILVSSLAKAKKELLKTRDADKAYMKKAFRSSTWDRKTRTSVITYAEEFCNLGDDLSYAEICRICLSNRHLTNDKKVKYDEHRESELSTGCVTKTVNTGKIKWIGCGPIDISYKHVANQKVLPCPIIEDGVPEGSYDQKRVIYVSNGPYTDDKSLSYFVYTDNLYDFPSERSNQQPKSDSPQTSIYEDPNIYVKLLLSVDVEDVKKILGNAPISKKTDGIGNKITKKFKSVLSKLNELKKSEKSKTVLSKLTDQKKSENSENSENQKTKASVLTEHNKFKPHRNNEEGKKEQMGENTSSSSSASVEMDDD